MAFGPLSYFVFFMSVSDYQIKWSLLAFHYCTFNNTLTTLNAQSAICVLFWGPLTKQNFTSIGSNGHVRGLWLVDFHPFWVSLLQGMLAVIVEKIKDWQHPKNAVISYLLNSRACMFLKGAERWLPTVAAFPLSLFSAAVLTGAIRNYDNDDTNSGNHNIPQKCTAITFKNSWAKITEVQVRGQFVTHAHIIHKSQQSFHVSCCLRWARVFILVPSKVDTALVSY